MESYLWFSTLSFFFSATLALYAWKHQKMAGAKIFFFILLCIMGMIIVQAGELLSTSLRSMVVYANLYYIFIQYAAVSFLLLTMHMVGSTSWLNNRLLMAVLFIIPIATQVLLWTNDLHHLIRRNVSVDDSGVFVLMSKTYGPAFWLVALSNFLLTFFSFAMLAAAMGVKSSLYRRQAALLFLGLLFPTASTFLTVFGVFPFGYDPTPAVFGLSAVIIFWGIFRYRLFDTIPIAHSAVIEGMNTGVVVIDANDRIVDYNPSAEKIFNLPRNLMLGKPSANVLGLYPLLLEIFQEKSTVVREFPIYGRSPAVWYEVTVASLFGTMGGHLGWLMTLHDITDRKIFEEKMRSMSLYDPLTDLPNRKLFFEFADKEIIKAKENSTMIGVAFIDLDDLKVINDAWGHNFGDVYLKETARRLSNVLSESNTVSRFGGDEFAILLPDLQRYEDLQCIAEKIFNAFGEAVSEEKQVFSIKASIGMCAYPKDGKDIHTLLKKADDGMYISKREGKNRFTLYQSNPDDGTDFVL